MLSEIATLGIVVAVMYGIAVGGWPGLAVNRTTLTVIGAVTLIGIGSIDSDAAWQAIDIPTLVILLGMMIINGQLEAAGLFGHAAYHITRWARHDSVLLLILMGICGVLSALFLNDTVVFLLTPLVIIIAQRTGTPVLPLLLGIATSANIGSAATITGNPQNVVIGTLSQLGFVPFVGALWLLCVCALLVAWAVICGVYWRQLTSRTQTPPLTLPAFRAPHTVLAIVILVGGLVAGVNPAVAVAGAGAVMLVRRTTPASSLIQHIDGNLLLFFAALFIVTAAFRESTSAQLLFTWASQLIAGRLDIFVGITAILSNLISNVPAVLVLTPLIPTFADETRAWVVLAASSTFAGNSTLLASVANLIVAERAAAQGVTLSFRDYLTVGLPITLITLLMTVWWFA
ncbi:MAG: hypothetical protein RL076_1361 [Chloroflexota bacterium]